MTANGGHRYITIIYISNKYQAGTKGGPDQLGPPVRVGSTRTNLDRIKKKKNNNQLGS